MKKILGLAGLLLLGCISIAHAQTQMVASHWVTEPLKFRSHAAAIGMFTYPNSGIDNLGGFVDSLTIMNNGASALDTTTAISTVGWAPPAGGFAADTVIVAQLAIQDAGSTTATSATDSIYVYPQGSFDGKTWFCLAVVPSVLPNTAVPGAIAGAAAPNGFGVLTQSASTAVGKGWALKFVGQSVGGTRVLLSIFDLARVPLVRFIVQTDASGAATYNLKGVISHWSSQSSLNR